MRLFSKPRRAAFTLIEILTVMVVILILASMLIPAYSEIRARIERVNCTNNLRQLYSAALAYTQENGHWPQVNPALLKSPKHAYDEAWIEALMPYGATRPLWICPTTQHIFGGPDYNNPENYRSDYVAMPFDGKRITPSRWPTQPWFVERGNMHGNGNLLILANGSVTDLNSLSPSGVAPQ